MKVLFIGDIVGTSGQKALTQFLPTLKQIYKPQLTIANGENMADGRGLNEKLYKQLLHHGIDVITMGNHTWDNREIFDFIDRASCLIRPINLPKTTPGVGLRYVKVNQTEWAIVNVLGSVFMSPCLDPFDYLPPVIETIRRRTPHILIDFHAEATSEKQALAWLLDGQVSAVLGTHTHVQTRDARILPQGTAMISDVGMTGCLDSVLGFRPQEAIRRFTSKLPARLEQATTDNIVLSAVLLDVDNVTGKTRSIEPIYITKDGMGTPSKRRFE
ncbi:TIGR00282 family metallophosphoesterase [Vaginisenegalia massiliensis]|uniref:TIGR00282 family metallophosphoesterase n=1 Tax=Vaginisenegalia massiliensis TaxID=2058294 RepID=UPI000F536B35|nr:TIGR00282 family metallophosphoesterase [Vaginisenegalia massiliensis]